MKSGPQRYPGASTAYWYGSRYPGSAMEVNVLCWHSTEGTSLPSYDGGSMAPNFTAKPDFAAKRLVWYQHFDFDVSSRALRNLTGGVETNTLNVGQVEIVGTCDPTTHAKWVRSGIQHLYMPELPDWAIRDLAAFAKWANTSHGVPLSSGLTFKPYPSSYGTNGVRMTGTQWNNFTGHCGHQHVPENDHGDPGAFPMAAILAAAKNGTTQEDDPMAGITKQDIADSVWRTDNIKAGSTEKDPKNTTWVAETYLKGTFENTVKLLTQETAQTAAIAKLAQLIGSDVDTAQVVAAVQKAIADAVIKVSVDVTSTQNQES
ncbi:hypothetical protein M2155_000562 [Streptomyces sp. SAI-119]|uniref:hypothetical protein n=1 Tax=Streptomyces sp. SAI-119 TaxID=2940541 RepID=UPI002476C450|nr:hypothetical protein [Streptomyces sp. SAI-119]MDH6448154.1 hypothetical protein [Streptomyces sp. SAI-119]